MQYFPPPHSLPYSILQDQTPPPSSPTSIYYCHFFPPHFVFNSQPQHHLCHPAADHQQPPKYPSFNQHHGYHLHNTTSPFTRLPITIATAVPPFFYWIRCCLQFSTTIASSLFLSLHPTFFLHQPSNTVLPATSLPFAFTPPFYFPSPAASFHSAALHHPFFLPPFSSSHHNRPVVRFTFLIYSITVPSSLQSTFILPPIAFLLSPFTWCSPLDTPRPGPEGGWRGRSPRTHALRGA